jgi:predicted RNase H-like HicB family nuclease
MLTRYIHEAMKRAQFKTLENGTCFGEIPGLAGVWANESTLDKCRAVLQEVLEEWLVLKIRDGPSRCASPTPTRVTRSTARLRLQPRRLP